MSLRSSLLQGKLVLCRSNARDLQLLVRLLGIDPDNVRVEALEEATKKRMVQSQLTASMGLIVKQSPPTAAKPEAAEETKTLPSRAAKRRASQEDQNGGKEIKRKMSIF